MEGKKVNIFAILLMMVMCVFSIFVSITNKGDNSNISSDILSIYKEMEELKKQVSNSQGKSAYELAVDGGFSGTEGEWLVSLHGDDGEDALMPVSIRHIYEAYLEETNQNEADFSYEEFLVYYYSVVKYDTKTATQLAYSTTVDICYSYTSYTCYVQQGTELSSGKVAYKPVEANSGYKGGVAAGAGVIYQMLNLDTTDNLLDTAYIITNYHVAYLENYSNDSNYIVYYNQASGEYFLGTKYSELIGTDKYFLEESIDMLTIDEGIEKHFLNGTDDEYYGIYLYGYQDADYKLNATFVGGSADNDIAVLKIERENLSSELANIFFDSGYYEEVNVGDSSSVVGGEEVIAVGNPLIPNTTSGMTIEQYEKEYIDAMVLSSTSGVVSSVSNEAAFESLLDSSKVIDMRLIRVDAAINSGNSGGGLYDLYGNLIGIVNSKMVSSSIDNVGYAIPINVASAIADQVISQCDGDAKTSQNTRIKILKTENLGFNVVNGVSNSKLITNSKGQKEWFVSYNILVSDIDETSLAYTAGLRNDDIITEITFGGLSYSSAGYFNQYYELDDLLLKVKSSDASISFKVTRNDATETYTINLSSEQFVEIC